MNGEMPEFFTPSIRPRCRLSLSLSRSDQHHFIHVDATAPLLSCSAVARMARPMRCAREGPQSDTISTNGDANEELHR